MLLLFFLVWVIFNGRLTMEIALFGIAVAGAVFAFVCRFMEYSLKKELRFYRLMPAFVQYLYYLIKEIVFSNITVSRMILTRKEEMEPVIVHVRTSLKSETARVILANSITLTPGTITVSSENGEFVVHCLDKDLAVGMDDSIFVHLLKKLERGADNE
jgi:multicomponent Na+:H+ antiporter subunit E